MLPPSLPDQQLTKYFFGHKLVTNGVFFFSFSQFFDIDQVKYIHLAWHQWCWLNIMSVVWIGLVCK